MEIQMSCDWLSVTIPNSDLNPNELVLGAWHREGVGMHGYKDKYIDHYTNAVCQSNGPAEMGTHYTLSGDVMRAIRDRGVSDERLAQRIIELGGRASRCDLCIDVFESDLTISGMYHAYQLGRVKCKAKTVMLVEERDSRGVLTGEAIDFGKRASDRYLRVYNKSLEQHIVDRGAWVRLEAELADMVARGAIGSVAFNGLAATTRGVIGDMVQWPDSDVYKAIMNGPVCDPPKAGRKDTKTESWLLTTVAKTLAGVIVNKPEFWDRFLASLAENSAIIRNNLENQGNG